MLWIKLSSIELNLIVYMVETNKKILELSLCNGLLETDENFMELHLTQRDWSLLFPPFPGVTESYLFLLADSFEKIEIYQFIFFYVY